MVLSHTDQSHANIALKSIVNIPLIQVRCAALRTGPSCTFSHQFYFLHLHCSNKGVWSSAAHRSASSENLMVLEAF